MNTQRLLTISRTLEQEVTKTSSVVGALAAHLAARGESTLDE